MAASRKHYTFEVCVDSIASALAAEHGGASRVELCASLVEGGITPSLGTIFAVKASISIPLHVLIRPRGGDFVYSDAEMDIMLMDIEHAKKAGVDGVVIGVLLANGDIDEERTLRLSTMALPMSVTFHRAFDVCRDPFDALETCIRLKIPRLLTSGQCNSAEEGVEMLRQLQLEARDRIVIMAGGGISEKNVMAIIRNTGVTELHGTLRVAYPSKMIFRKDPPIYMGGEKRNEPEAEFAVKQTSAERVAAIMATISNLQL